MRKLLLVLLPLLAAIGLTLYYAFERERSGKVPTALGPNAGTVEPASASQGEPAETPGELASERVESEAPALATTAKLAAPGAEKAAEIEHRTALSGRIVDTTGHGIANADVSLRSPESFGFFGRRSNRPPAVDAKTDSEGRFHFETKQFGGVELLASASRYAPHTQDLVLQGSGEQALGEITLARGVVIDGAVVDLGGNPVPGAEIHRPLDLENGFFRLDGTRAGELLAVTDEKGVFELDRLAVGPWSLVVTSTDHPDASLQGETSVPDQEVHDLLVRLEDGASIRGRVRGLPESGTERFFVRAIEDAGSIGQGGVFEDGAFRPSRRADPAADGSFDVRGLVIGKSYRLVLLPDEPAELGFSRSASVVARAGDRGVELVHSKGTAIVCQVVDARTGLAITDFQVEAGTDWPTPLTDSSGKILQEHPDGLVRYEGLRPRASQKTGRLIVDAVGYERYEQSDIPLSHDGEVDLGRIALEPMPVVRVHVRGAKTGEPIAGARVELLGPEEPAQPTGEFRARRFRAAAGDMMQGGTVHESGQTDANGIARVRSLPGQRAQVVVSNASGYATWKSAELVLAATGDTEVEALLTRGGGMRVLARDSEGTPITGIGVGHRSSGEPAPMRFAMGGGVQSDATTDASGAALFENLTPGRHLFQLQEQRGGGGGGGMLVLALDDGADEEGWTEGFVAEDEIGELVLLASARGQLVGHVTQGGVPLPGAKITLQEDSDAPRMSLPGMGGPSTKSDGKGRFQFDDVAGGDYSVLVDHVSRAMEESFDVRIEGGENTIEIELSVAMVEGRVLDEKGEPVPGARVTLERAAGAATRGVVTFAFRVAGDDDEGTTMIGGMGADKRTTTDADGRYVLRGVPSDVELRVSVRHDPYQPARSKDFHVARDEVRRDVDVELLQAGVAEVTVRRTNGTGAGMALVEGRFEGESEQPIEPVVEVADKDGKAVLQGLRAGTWRIKVLNGGPGEEQAGEKSGQTVVIETGKTAQVNLDL